MKFKCHDQLNGVQLVIETKQDNDVTDRIGLFNPEIKTQLSRLFDLVRFVMLTKQDNDVTNYTGAIYVEKET